MSAELDFIEQQKHPVARFAAAAAMWLRTAPAEEQLRDPVMSLRVAEALEQAWRHPKAPRIALVMLETTYGWNRRELSRILGISPIQYNQIKLSAHPFGRAELEKLAASQEVPLEELQQVVLLAHVLLVGMETVWEITWQEALEPLSPRERRAKVMEDKSLQSWGLGELVCAKSLETADPAEAVTLAELALLILEKTKLRAGIKRRLQGFAWGHLGHALEIRGNHAAAGAAYDECIKLWTTGEGIFEREDRKRAEHLASIVPSFPPYTPPPRERKPAKRTKASKPKPRARRAE